MNDITYAVSVDVNNPIIPYNVYVASVLDSNVRYLEITLYQNGNVITLSNTATATASLVTDNVLVDDSVNCTISDNIITVPLEDLQRHGNLDVQVTVTEGTRVLAIPFPIQVRVTPNIAENAQIDSESEGSYAEVVHEISEARGSYTDLKDRFNHIENSEDELRDALALKANAQDVNTALAQKVGIADMVPYLHYVGVSAPAEGTKYSLGDLTPNSYSYVGSSWFQEAECPQNAEGAAWVFTIIPKNSAGFGMQIWIVRDTNVVHIRRKNTSGWGSWDVFIKNDPSLSVGGAFADAKAVGDALAEIGNAITPCLKYSSDTPSSDEDALTRLEKNTILIANGANWADAPTSSVGVVTTLKNSSNNYGIQIWISNAPTSNQNYQGIYVRRFSGNTWTAWSSPVDATLSKTGLAADAKTVGDALAQKVNIANMAPYLHYVGVSAPAEGTKYSLGDLTPNSYSYVVPSWFQEAECPQTAAGVVWVFTIIPKSNSSYGIQFWFEPANNILHIRKKTKQQDGSYAWGEWVRLDDAYDSGRTYFAFGDSLVKGQIGRWSGSTRYSKRGYPDTTAAMLHMTLNNQAVGGQGLIKDWALIIDTINALDMHDAGLITVGWYGNDGAIYRKAGLAMGSYTDVTTVDVTDTTAVKALVTYDSEGVPAPNGFGTTVIGYYFTIMKLLQTKCPNAQIVLVTGYGNAGGDRATQKLPTFIDQFTAVRTFGEGASHTYQEMFNELEKMANLHGWGCVNQARGCAFNEFNAELLFGDHAHPTDDGYAKYGNNLAPRIASFYANRKLITYDLL